MVRRPTQLVFVTGTGTDAGKTWFAAATLTTLREQGATVAARKPVQSFAPEATTIDAAVLGAATGEAPESVCPTHRSYELAMAPPMAADALGRDSFSIAELTAEIVWPTSIDVGVIEGVGGPRSPVAHDGDNVDLVRALSPDIVVLVADAGLGTINAVRLSLDAFSGCGAPVIVALNRFEDANDLHRRNRAWLETRVEADLIASPTQLASRLRSDA